MPVLRLELAKTFLICLIGTGCSWFSGKEHWCCNSWNAAASSSVWRSRWTCHFPMAQVAVLEAILAEMVEPSFFCISAYSDS